MKTPGMPRALLVVGGLALAVVAGIGTAGSFGDSGSLWGDRYDPDSTSTHSESTAVAQDDGDLSGAWFVEEVQVGDRVVSNPMPGMVFFSDGYFAVVDAQGPRTFEEPGNPTQAEKAAAYENFGALAGEYEMRSDTFFRRTYVSLDPGTMSGWPDNTQPLATVRVEGERATFDYLGNPMEVTFRRLDGTSLPR